MTHPNMEFLVALTGILAGPLLPLLPTAGFFVTSTTVAILFRRSFHLRSVALFAMLTMMFIQSMQFLLLGLNIVPFSSPPEMIPIIATDSSKYLSMLSDLGLTSAELGSVAAAFAAIYLLLARSRLDISKVVPDATLIESPIHITEIAQDLANRMSLRCPEVRLVDTGTPMAFTTTVNRKYVIAVSVGLLECLDTREVEACIAHEMAHLKNNDFTIRFLATLGKVALFAKPASYLIEAAIYRAREFLADKTAALVIGGPEPLISALTKLCESDTHSSFPSNRGLACAFLSHNGEGLFRVLHKHPTLRSRVKLLSELRSS